LICAPLGTVSWLFVALLGVSLAFWLILLIKGGSGVQASTTVLFRLSYFSLFAAIWLGVWFGLVSLPGWIRRLRFLRYGVVTPSRLVQKLAKNTAFSCPMTGASGTQVLMELTFEHAIGGATYTTTMTRVPEWHLSRLDLGASVATLVDPRKPSSAMTDDLPRWLEITASGELRVRSGTSLHLLIVPVTFVVQLVAAMI
jgi:hypothetical protein